MNKELSPAQRFIVTDAERQVADLLPIAVDTDVARAALLAIPFWFHTFALNAADGIYTPGAARDHRYRLSFLPADFTIQDARPGCWHVRRLLRVPGRASWRGTGVGARQRAVRLWVAACRGIELEGGAGFRAIHRLLDSRV